METLKGYIAHKMSVDVKPLIKKLIEVPTPLFKCEFVFPEDILPNVEDNPNLATSRPYLRPLIYKTNELEIKTSDFIIANVDKYADGRDSGVMWECGYASGAGLLVITYTTEDTNRNRNIMIEEGSHLHFSTFDEIIEYWPAVCNLIYLNSIERN